MVKIVQFHPHELKFYSPKSFKDEDDHLFLRLNCDVCGRDIDHNRGAYGCADCKFFIDIDCGKYKNELKHPFHPQHTLSLINVPNDPSSNFRCKACRYSIQDFAYKCSQCEFHLDLVCASLIPTSSVEMHLIESPHPLFVCDNLPGYGRKCCCCHLDLSEHDTKIYICVECSQVLHKTCASLKEIKHPFHVDHVLTLLSPPQSEDHIECAFCSVKHKNEGPYMFQCKQCDFTLDYWCALLKPVEFHPTVVQNRLHSHKHKLIECDYIKEFPYPCHGCGRRFQDSIFACLECRTLLDRSCAYLPIEITHPYHTQHPFQLNQREGKSSYKCWLCNQEHFSVFDYSCSCNFHLDPSCALTKPIVIHTVFHEHLLAYFTEKFDAFISCHACEKRCTENFLYCAECSCYCHLRCYSKLPRLVKHSCHCDPLTLTKSKIKDDPEEGDDVEFYCNACEKLRDLNHPTYYCEECHFVAHPHCVVSEIVRYLETESTHQSLGNVKLDTSVTDLCNDNTIRTTSSTAENLEKPEEFDIDVAKEERFSSEGASIEMEEETDSSEGDELETSELSAQQMIAAIDESITMIEAKAAKMMAKVERMMIKVERLMAKMGKLKTEP